MTVVFVYMTNVKPAAHKHVFIYNVHCIAIIENHRISFVLFPKSNFLLCAYDCFNHRH